MIANPISLVEKCGLHIIPVVVDTFGRPVVAPAADDTLRVTAERRVQLERFFFFFFLHPGVERGGFLFFFLSFFLFPPQRGRADVVIQPGS